MIEKALTHRGARVREVSGWLAGVQFPGSPERLYKIRFVKQAGGWAAFAVVRKLHPKNAQLETNRVVRIGWVRRSATNDARWVAFVDQNMVAGGLLFNTRREAGERLLQDHILAPFRPSRRR